MAEVRRYIWEHATVSYPKEVARRVLEMSVSKTFTDAIREWYWTKEATDHEQCVANCELCGKENLRYQFSIKNQRNQREMSVGSKCILRFGVAVHDEHGGVLVGKDAKHKLNDKLKDMRNSACLDALQKLSEAEANDILSNALDYWRRHGYLSPKLAFVVYWRLQKNGIEYNASFFKIGLRQKKHQDDLRNMKTLRVHYIWAGLSSPQRKKAEELGHVPPHPPA